MEKQGSVVARLTLINAVSSLCLLLRCNRMTITCGLGVLLGFVIRLSSYEKFPSSFGHAAIC
jgi:hypothetical protein